MKDEIIEIEGQLTEDQFQEMFEICKKIETKRDGAISAVLEQEYSIRVTIDHSQKCPFVHMWIISPSDIYFFQAYCCHTKEHKFFSIMKNTKPDEILMLLQKAKAA